MRRTIENTTPQEILPIIWRMIEAYTRQMGHRPSHAFLRGMLSVFLFRALGHHSETPYRKGRAKREAYQLGQREAWQIDTAPLFAGRKQP